MVLPGIVSFLVTIKQYKGRKIGIITHQAACTPDFEFSVWAMLKKGLKIEIIFSPEHGFFSEEQDQKPVGDSELFGIPVKSIYGDTLVPDRETLSNLDTLVIDIVDVGTRYYTYVWSAVLVLKELSGMDIEVVVLDRPNPLGGEFLEGPLLKEEFFSFVGLLPIPVVHGMTVAELLLFAREYYKLDLDIKVYPLKNWKRRMLFHETGLAFIPPSPNMPFLNTAFVYPGMCLLEATNVSEGRGTTRPFEIFGAPFIDPFQLVGRLKDVKGAVVRPYYFIPTFNKYAGAKLGGGFIHVTSFKEFRPFEFGVRLLGILKELYPDVFEFTGPPYEYEYDKMPIDILTGDDFIRKNISLVPLEEMKAMWEKDIELFREQRENFLLYA